MPCGYARSVRWPLLVSCFSLTLSLAVGSAQAQSDEDANRAAARALGEAGIAAFNAGDYVIALDKLSRAHELVGLSTTGLWMARSLVKVGRWVEASEQYLAVTRMTLPEDASELHRNALGEAARERQELLPRIPQLTLRIDGLPAGSAPEVSIDGVAVPGALIGAARPTNPGDHQVQARAGGQQQSAQVSLGEGERRTVAIRFEGLATAPAPDPNAAPPADPAPEQPPDGATGSTQRILGWVAVGLGGAGLVVGGVTGGMAVGERSTLSDECPDKECGPDQHDQVDSYETLRVVSSVGFIAGGVLAAAGVVLLITAPDDAEQSATWFLGPGSVGLTGRF